MSSPDDNPNQPNLAQREVCRVPAARLGDRGDIDRSYSADLIAANGQVRKPFQHSGNHWICTTITGGGLTQSGQTEHEGYRLTPERMFIGTQTTYAAKIWTAEAADSARKDPFGFYHGIAVRHASEAFVMSGPPLRFVADSAPSRPNPDTPEPTQLALF